MTLKCRHEIHLGYICRHEIHLGYICVCLTADIGTSRMAGAVDIEVRSPRLMPFESDKGGTG